MRGELKMGFDIVGRRPLTEEGEYFRNSVWAWHPLAAYICEIAPGLASRCTYWHDGDGLNAEDAVALADRLDTEIKEGRCECFARIHASEQEKAPDEACDFCEGTGVRREPVPERGAGGPIIGIQCNWCRGKGTVRPWRTNYPFSVENVQRFITFLRGCCGFSIW
jgi:hypothetical protein